MIEITVDSAAISSALAKLGKRLDNLRPAMDGIGQELESRIRGRFETRTDPLGTAWALWKPSTRENYPKDGNGRLLDRYGDMLASLNFKADESSVRVGFGAVASRAGDVYAAYHEWGTVKMARRGMLFADPDSGTLSPDDEEAVLSIVNGFLSDGL